MARRPCLCHSGHVAGLGTGHWWSKGNLRGMRETVQWFLPPQTALMFINKDISKLWSFTTRWRNILCHEIESNYGQHPSLGSNPQAIWRYIGSDPDYEKSVDSDDLNYRTSSELKYGPIPMKVSITRGLLAREDPDIAIIRVKM